MCPKLYRSIGDWLAQLERLHFNSSDYDSF